MKKRKKKWKRKEKRKKMLEEFLWKLKKIKRKKIWKHIISHFIPTLFSSDFSFKLNNKNWVSFLFSFLFSHFLANPQSSRASNRKAWIAGRVHKIGIQPTSSFYDFSKYVVGPIRHKWVGGCGRCPIETIERGHWVTSHHCSLDTCPQIVHSTQSVPTTLFLLVRLISDKENAFFFFGFLRMSLCFLRMYAHLQFWKFCIIVDISLRPKHVIKFSPYRLNFNSYHRS